MHMGLCNSPVIKAIFPQDGKIHTTAETTPFYRMRETSIGVQLGVNEHAKFNVQRAQSIAHAGYTVPYVSTSGVHTSRLSLTMNEDSSLRDGVARSLCFGMLLEFDSAKRKSFRALLEIESQSRKELPFKLWTSPKRWDLYYDGKTELGHVDFDT
ncbi:hypothetical protein PtA15_9A70 [Puccinia triticina]|uniref:Uncharacterized protein n=1 Tax=Puccinia triticina TaxID=208348 RepID=A0ABY7CRQ6_9BASI|nr:uncharacterized protein PtA15_9A70 [Puccinia triticina]WAQ87946.1 hypothetical protein PtA15_9A70 [Puccinia triticina]